MRLFYQTVLSVNLYQSFLIHDLADQDDLPVSLGHLSHKLKEGAEMKFLAQDACILISTLLRVGVAPEAIAEMSSKVSENILGKVQDVHGSMIGVIVAQLLIPRLGYEGEV